LLKDTAKKLREKRRESPRALAVGVCQETKNPTVSKKEWGRVGTDRRKNLFHYMTWEAFHFMVELLLLFAGYTNHAFWFFGKGRHYREIYRIS